MEHQTILLCNEPSPISPTPTTDDEGDNISPAANTINTITNNNGKNKRDNINMNTSFGSPLTFSDSSGYESIHSLDDDDEHPTSINNHQQNQKLHYNFSTSTSSYLINNESPCFNNHRILSSSSSTSTINGQLDQNWLDDNERILKRMLDIEHRYVPWNVDNKVYCSGLFEINAKIRYQLVEWMNEVCEALKCEEGIFTLSVNFLDRIMLVMSTLPKSQLQLVAIVCMLIASKIRQSTSFDLNYLSYSSNYTYSVNEILVWEPVILKQLEWDVGAVIATDYLDYILVIVSRLFEEQQHHKSTMLDNHHRHHKHGCYYATKLSQFDNNNNDEEESCSEGENHKFLSSSTTENKNNKKNFRMANKRQLPPAASIPLLDDHDDEDDEQGLASHQTILMNKRFKSDHHHHFNDQNNHQSSSSTFLSNTMTTTSSHPPTLSPSSSTSIVDTIRRHANTFILICSTELSFVCVKPSVIAAVCVATAIRGIIGGQQNRSKEISPTGDRSSHAKCCKRQSSFAAHHNHHLYDRFLSLIEQYLNIDTKTIEAYVEQMENLTASKLQNIDPNNLISNHKSHTTRHNSQHDVNLRLIPADGSTMTMKAAFTDNHHENLTTKINQLESFSSHQQQQQRMLYTSQPTFGRSTNNHNQHNHSQAQNIFFKWSNDNVHSNSTMSSTTIITPSNNNQQQQSQQNNFNQTTFAQVTKQLFTRQQDYQQNSMSNNIPNDFLSNNEFPLKQQQTQTSNTTLADLLDYFEQEDRENIPFYIIDLPVTSTPIHFNLDNQENVAPTQTTNNTTNNNLESNEQIDELDDITEDDLKF